MSIRCKLERLRKQAELAADSADKDKPWLFLHTWDGEHLFERAAYGESYDGREPPHELAEYTPRDLPALQARYRVTVCDHRSPRWTAAEPMLVEALSTEE